MLYFLEKHSIACTDSAAPQEMLKDSDMLEELKTEQIQPLNVNLIWNQFKE